MKYFIYQISNLGQIELCEIMNGNSQCIKKFKNREDMLIYLENEYDFFYLQKK